MVILQINLTVRFMKHRHFLIALLCALAGIVTGQNIIVKAEPAVTDLMDRYTTESKAVETVKGWRIQIITTDNRREMETARAKFKGMHPDLYLEWDHVVPYYKIKVGAFREKIDLQGFLVELRRDFPSAIPIQDDVNKRELVY